MNRRDMLKAIASGGTGAALGVVASIEVAKVAVDDVIVFQAQGSISSETAERIKTYAGQVWPGRRIVVVGDGMTVKIMRGERA